jgi:hypothetical protein
MRRETEPIGFYLFKLLSLVQLVFKLVVLRVLADGIAQGMRQRLGTESRLFEVIACARLEREFIHAPPLRSTGATWARANLAQRADDE